MLFHNLCFVPADMIAVYIVLYIGINNFLLRKKVLLFFLVFHVALVSIVIASFYITIYVIPDQYKLQELNNTKNYEWFTSVLSTYMVLGSASVLKILKAWYYNLQEKLQLENQNIKSELDLLRSQINPHFLFNTLNNIDALTYGNPEKASDSIIKLSDIMRYMLYESNTDKVTLEKEIEYLESYIDLLRLRLNVPNYIEFRTEGNFEDVMVPPMLFVPFIENAFKHGSKKVAPPGIVVSLKVTDRDLFFLVANFSSSSKVKDKIGGIGLSNIKRRLKLIYKDQYDLKIEDSNDMFEVALKIPVS